MRFAYSGIRREDCEGKLFYSPLVECSVVAYKLFSVGFSHYWSVSRDESVLFEVIPLQWRGLEYLRLPLFPALVQAILSFRLVQPGYQTLEAVLRELDPESLLSNSPCVGSCLMNHSYATLFQ